MAHIKNIRWLAHLAKPNTLRVDIAIKPMGEATLDVVIPEEFMDCVIRICQLSADKLEQEMRANILADAAKEQTP